MKAWERILAALREQLCAVVPGDCQEGLDAHLYTINVTRYAIQSIVVMGMDLFSLLCYLLMYRMTGAFSAPHILIHLGKILLMALCFVWTYRACRAPYTGSFLQRRSIVFYPMLHAVCEFALFVSGPQDLGALCRLLAVPFVVASIPIIRQNIAFVMQLFIYIIYFGYLISAVSWQAEVGIFSEIINFWIVAFACANLIAFTVYSWFVNTYVARKQEREARQALSALNERLDYLSRRDSLTGLFNRRGFRQFMDETWTRHAATNHFVTVIMIDIDYFKRYNDRFGHLSGDQCLSQVTAVIREELTESDYIVARYGGEEFIVVAYDQVHDEMVTHADRLRRNVLKLKLEHPDSEINAYVTVSMGVATQRTSEMENFHALVDWADECLYYAKRAGRNRVIHTFCRPGAFQDVHGADLSQLSGRIDAERNSDPEYTDQLLREIGANCTFVYDGGRQMLQFSQAAVKLFDLPRSMTCRAPESLSDVLGVHPEDRRRFLQILKAALDNREVSFSLEVNLQRRGLGSLPVFIDGQMRYSQEAGPDLIFGAIISISRLIEYQHFLRQQPGINSITLLPNREQLLVDMQQILENPGDDGHILFLDVRGFKRINNDYSRSIGDRMLWETARRLTRFAGELPAYSYDVDQFVVLAAGIAREEADRMMKIMYRYFNEDSNLVEGLDLRADYALIAVTWQPGRTTLDQLFLDLDTARQMARLTDQTCIFF